MHEVPRDLQAMRRLALTEFLLAEPNEEGGVALERLPELGDPESAASLRASAVHGFLQATPIDRATRESQDLRDVVGGVAELRHALDLLL